jgi:hypothetical protein
VKVELDINAVVVGKDDRLVLVVPQHTFPAPREGEEDLLEGLMKAFAEIGLGRDRVLVICADDVQMASVAS